MTRYVEFYRRSLADRDGFWAEQSKLIEWKQARLAGLALMRELPARRDLPCGAE